MKHRPPSTVNVRSRLRIDGFDIFLLVVFSVVSFVMVFPLLHVLAVSFSSPLAIIRREVVLIPKNFTAAGYGMLMRSQNLLLAYKNTIVYTVAHTAIALFVCSFTAYPLSIQKFIGRRVATIYVTIPMFITGGLIPTFLLIRFLGLYNTMWAVVVPGAFSTWYIILYRANFLTLPDSLRESAYIDGANDIRIWVSIYMPLTKAIFATIAVFAAVSMWTSFFQPYIYLSDAKKYPLQIILRKLLLEGRTKDLGDYQMFGGDSSIAWATEGVTELLKHVATIVTIGPILLVYPFAQRYFIKGALVGSIKG